MSFTQGAIVTPRIAVQRTPKQPLAKKLASADRILDVAISLFSRNGFEGTSTTEIGLGAGIAQSVVLYHFATKDALWRGGAWAGACPLSPRAKPGPSRP